MVAIVVAAGRRGKPDSASLNTHNVDFGGCGHPALVTAEQGDGRSVKRHEKDGRPATQVVLGPDYAESRGWMGHLVAPTSWSIVGTGEDRLSYYEERKRVSDYRGGDAQISAALIASESRVEGRQPVVPYGVASVMGRPSTRRSMPPG